MTKSESGVLKIKELEKVVFDRRKKNMKYEKTRELRAGGVSSSGWGDGLGYERRAVTRPSHTIIVWKDSNVNTYLCGKNYTTGGSESVWQLRWRCGWC